MYAYGIDYTYKGIKYSAFVDAKDKASAKNKIGRKHGLKASQSRTAIKLIRVNVIGYL